MLKICTPLIGIGILSLAAGTAGAAAPRADTVMTNLVQAAPRPHTFEANTSMQLKKRGFPWTNVALQGKSYFAAPDHLVVKFNKVPGYMHALPSAYAKIINVAAWPNEYDATLGPEQPVNGHPDYALLLKPKDPKSGDRGVALVDPASWTVEKVTWNLSGGVTLTMAEDYSNVGSYRVPASQTLSVHTPYATADGTAKLQDYRVNVPIDRNVFANAQQ